MYNYTVLSIHFLLLSDDSFLQYSLLFIFVVVVVVVQGGLSELHQCINSGPASLSFNKIQFKPAEFRLRLSLLID